MNSPFNFELVGEDALGVLTTTAPVARGSERVRINAEAVIRFARAYSRTVVPAQEQESLHHISLPPARYLNYLLALEALNFCFWDEEPRWRVEYQGKTHDGYWALAAALRRGIEEDGLPVWDAEFLADLSDDVVAGLLRGSGRPVPLLKARGENLREAGRVLLERWGGWFENMVKESGGDAVRLVKMIVEEFPSFRDQAEWRGKMALFYKRAQICAADMTRLATGDSPGRLTGLEKLTAFADYKVPQVLRREGILEFSPALAGRIDKMEPLTHGSEEEVEIRAATIWGVEWITRALKESQTGGNEGLASAAEVDYLLWRSGQDKSGLPPYHRTRTIYY